MKKTSNNERNNSNAKTARPDLLRMRYEALYGKTEGARLAAKDRRSTRMVITLLVVCFIAAVALVVSGYFAKENDIKTDKTGRIISVERPAEGGGSKSVDVRVWAVSGDTSVERDKQLFVEEVGNGEEDDDEGIMAVESESDKLARRIDTAVRSVNEDTSTKNVYLPSKLEDGTVLVWKKKKKNDLPMVLLVFVAAFSAVYMGRNSRIKKEEQAARDSITRELPEFINKTVLLLQGGIVINEALVRVIRDRAPVLTEERNGRADKQENKAKNRVKEKKSERSYFYRQMAMIEARSAGTNSPLHEELTSFARRSGVQELMRVANIISDNIGKGSDLTGKLMNESSMLWFARKKHAEEKGRLAETKLTVPLVILICVLVMITIAPALMEI
jgi:hypothetical protein